MKVARLILLAAALQFAGSSRAQVAPVINDAPLDDATMQRLYDEVKTPFKYGVVLKGDSTNQLVDCPSIFRDNGKWYMMYVAISNGVGYETFLASSDDLLNWKKLGKILSFAKNGWDAWQADGGLALVDYEWNGSHTLGQFNGKFWLSYIGGALQGYETDPLSIGMAWTKTPTEAKEWTRLAENPVLGPKDTDAREFERKTLYKSSIIHDRTQRLGAPFVMYYNAKVKNGYERIGMALSTNLVDWTRFGTNCVLANGEEKRNGMSGDPQLVKIGDVWVMFYFGAGWGPKAFDTFAASKDMVNWTKWTGPTLIEPSEPWDKTYAHKPWVLKHEGVVYHFYCAVGTEGRVIGLATSTDLRVEKKQP
ncbi:MAG: glycosylase [Verrucomicrobiota bacterium]